MTVSTESTIFHLQSNVMLVLLGFLLVGYFEWNIVVNIMG